MPFELSSISSLRGYLLPQRETSSKLHVTKEVDEMSVSPKKKVSDGGTSQAKVSAHRARLRQQGLRPIQIWVPDTRQPNFGVEAARQSKLLSHSRLAAEDQSFVDAISELDLS